MSGIADPARDRARSGALMAMVSMCCVQLGLAASVGLIDRIGAEGAAWLRLFWAGVVFVVLGRPWRLRLARPSLAVAVLLGAITGLLTLLFMAAVARLPLGTASALEFLGPLGVAVLRGGGGRGRAGRARAGRGRLLWPLLAGVGVVLLTEPWAGRADPAGVAFALAAAGCWAAYILLTQRVGDEVAGLAGLSVSMPVAALVATAVVGPEVLPRMSLGILALGIGLACLLPVVPFTLELLALRRLTTAAFGTLMSLEPAIALTVGFLALGQTPGGTALVGVGFVVAAGVGAERTGGREAPVTAG